jgi:hypothetical protein
MIYIDFKCWVNLKFHQRLASSKIYRTHLQFYIIELDNYRRLYAEPDKHIQPSCYVVFSAWSQRKAIPFLWLYLSNYIAPAALSRYLPICHSAT